MKENEDNSSKRDFPEEVSKDGDRPRKSTRSPLESFANSDAKSDKLKKLRSTTAVENDADPPGDITSAKQIEPITTISSSDFPQSYSWTDLESALHRINGSNTDEINSDDDNNKEYLSVDDESRWLTFRWGHAGDASTIATWYKESASSFSNSGNSTGKPTLSSQRQVSSMTAAAVDPDNPLELWLEKGLGCEDRPPSVMALLAQVNSNSSYSDKLSSSSSIPDSDAKVSKESNATPNNNENTNSPTGTITELAAVALLTISWEDGKRLLRVEWYYVDSLTSASEVDLVGRRLLLRLTALALLTASTLAVDETMLKKFIIFPISNQGVALKAPKDLNDKETTPPEETNTGKVAPIEKVQGVE